MILLWPVNNFIVVTMWGVDGKKVPVLNTPEYVPVPRSCRDNVMYVIWNRMSVCNVIGGIKDRIASIYITQ